MRKVTGIFRLLRLERATSAVAGVIISGIIVKDLTMFQWDYLATCLAVFFSALANFSLNDYHDVVSDIVNERSDRPLAIGVLEPVTALKLTISATLLAYLFASQSNSIACYMIMIGLPISLFYNVFLKKKLIFKNIFIGLANSCVILLGALVTDVIIEPFAYYMALVAFFFTISYEVMLDIADLEGDKAMGIDTLPGRFGKRKAAYLSVLIGVGAVFVNPLPFFISVDPNLFRDPIFLALILIPVFNRLRISRSLLLDQSPENISDLKNRLFRNLQIGGLCYLIGFLV
jgi:4-hydroxybenzoate polyprenyltransferase